MKANRLNIAKSVCCAVVTAFLAIDSVAAAGPLVLDHNWSVWYTGSSRNGVEAFLGIPYGHDTGGEERFKPPRLFVPEPGSTVNATATGPACPQDTIGPLGAILPGVSSISEDCLSLNIVRPAGTTEDDSLPVMVWIHGGSLWAGQGRENYSVPDSLVAQSVANGLPVIHVAMNYRLGIFGFAQSEALRGQRSENAGLRDQRLALEWIRGRIGFFGGDPSRITIFGQSSGGLSVGIQILAYGGGMPVPFQQAICESQALETSITSNVTTGAMRDVVNHLGISSDLQSAETIAALRALDMATLLNATKATYTSSVMDGDIWLPAVDGDFIPEAPSKLIEEHRFGRVRTMIGWCQGDENLFTNTSVATADDTRRAVASFAFGLSPANLDRLLALYPLSELQPGKELSAEFYRTSRIKRDILMVCQPIHYGRHLAAAGNDVFLYDWNQTFLDTVYHDLGSPEGLGVVHFSDVPYVYGNPEVFQTPSLPPFLTQSDFKLAHRASRTFSTFASVGKPGLPGHDTFQGFVPAFESRHDDNVNIFIAGGPSEGSSAIDGPGAKAELSGQRLRERCDFLNSAEVIEQLMY